MNLKDIENQYLADKKIFVDELSSSLNFHAYHVNSTNYINSLRGIVDSLNAIDHHELIEGERKPMEILKFQWSIDTLDIAILLRDIQIRVSKELVLSYDALEKGEALVEVIPSKYRDIIIQALDENESLLLSTLSNKGTSKPEWFHQISPTKEIVSQFSELIDQKELIHESHEMLKELSPKLIEHREYVLDYNNKRLQKIRGLEVHLSDIVNLINETPTEVSRDEILLLSKNIEKVGASIENEKVNLVPYDPFTTDVGETKIPIYSNGGELVYKNISLSKHMESWTENELFPKMYDVDSDISSLLDSSLITIYNTRNKLENLALTEQEKLVFGKSQFNESVKRKHNEVDSYIGKLDSVIHEVNTLVSDEFRVDKIYNQSTDFLAEKGFANISKITNQRLWYERDLWSSLKAKSIDYVAKRNLPFINRLKQDPYTFVSSRQIDDHNLDINSLFLKKGYLGRSFYIPRQKIQDDFSRCFEQWRDGFRGSVLITGKYGAGKSSFLQFIPYFLVDEQVVSVSQNNVLKVNGRKHQVTGDLGATIGFLASQSINKKIVVCIDNLELWKSPERSLYDTIRDLVDGIGKYGKRLFFVVATNHYMLSHINKLFDFDSRFAQVINVDNAAHDVIREAIVVRHNASLKEFDIEEQSSILKKAGKIAIKSRYNLGSAMLAWERLIDHDILPDSPPPSFHKLVEKHKLMLGIVLTYNKISESSLRKSMTSADNNFISEEIRKLMGYKLLNRTFDGYIQINPFIADEIEHSLLN